MKELSSYINEGFYKNVGNIQYSELEADFYAFIKRLFAVAKNNNWKMTTDSPAFRDVYKSTDFYKLPLGTVIKYPCNDEAFGYYVITKVREDTDRNPNPLFSKWRISCEKMPDFTLHNKHVKYGDGFVINQMVLSMKINAKKHVLDKITIEFYPDINNI